MIRSWKTLGLNALTAALLAAHPVLADEKREATTDAQRLEAIQKQLRELTARLGEMEKSFDDFKTTMETDLRLGGQIARNHKDQIADLSRQVTQLHDDIEAIRRAGASPQRTSGFLSTDTAAPPAGTGRVELINTYPEDVAVVVNGRTYHLRPGERRLTDPIPAGTFTYEVLGVTPMNTRTVAANRIFTVHIHPQ
jgi:hypothetical protein